MLVCSTQGLPIMLAGSDAPLHLRGLIATLPAAADRVNIRIGDLDAALLDQFVELACAEPRPEIPLTLVAHGRGQAATGGDAVAAWRLDGRELVPVEIRLGGRKQVAVLRSLHSAGAVEEDEPPPSGERVCDMAAARARHLLEFLRDRARGETFARKDVLVRSDKFVEVRSCALAEAKPMLAAQSRQEIEKEIAAALCTLAARKEIEVRRARRFEEWTIVIPRK